MNSTSAGLERMNRALHETSNGASAIHDEPQCTDQDCPALIRGSIEEDTRRGVTKQQIANIEDAGSARELSKRFNPPASLSECTNVDEMKERLLQAWKAHAKMRNLQTVSDMWLLVNNFRTVLKKY